MQDDIKKSFEQIRQVAEELQGISTQLEKAAPGNGLVAKKVLINKDGKSFYQTVYVREGAEPKKIQEASMEGWDDATVMEYREKMKERFRDLNEEASRGNALTPEQKKDVTLVQRRLAEATIELDKRKKAKVAAASETGQTQVFASSGTQSGILRMMRDFYGGSLITMNKLPGDSHFTVFNSKGKIEGVSVVTTKGKGDVRYNFGKSTVSSAAPSATPAKVAETQSKPLESGGKKVVGHESFDHPAGGKLNKGDKVSFDHKGEMKTGTVVKTNVYQRFANPYVLMKGDDGKTYELVISKVNKKEANSSAEVSDHVVVANRGRGQGTYAAHPHFVTKEEGEKIAEQKRINQGGATAGGSTSFSVKHKDDAKEYLGKESFESVTHKN
jgi:hypothetical protein